MNADATFAKRAAARLNKVLDEEGYPFDLLGRSTALGNVLSISATEGQHLLSGIVPWTWDQLEGVCRSFSRRPGYFLDPGIHDSLPSDTEMVTSSDGGESLVLRTPRGFLRGRTQPDARLRYLTERDTKTPYPVGSLLVYAEQQYSGPGMLRAGGTYVVEREGALEVMRCHTIHDSLASFEPLRPGVSVVVPYARATEPANPEQARIAGDVLVSVSPV